MYLELYSKAIESAESARNCLDEGKTDSAVNRAYYATFNAARAFLDSIGVDVEGSHGNIVRLFGLHAVKSGKLAPDLGRGFNRLQGARSIADYDSVSVPLVDVEAYVASAEKFVDQIGLLLPRLPSALKRGPSAKELAESEIKRSLAIAFCMAAEARGEALPTGLEEQLVLYGTRETLTDLIAEIGEMNDLASFLTRRFPHLQI